jgi:hypothetical protein
MIAGRRRWIETLRAQGMKVPGGRKPGSRIAKLPKPMTAAAKGRAAVQLPRGYRHMTHEEFFEAVKNVLKQSQERFERTGRLID